jgi:hypothetical protein
MVMKNQVSFQDDIVLATTHVVRDTVFTPESLRAMAEQRNRSDRKVRILVEHDRLCPPLGQVIGYRVEPIEGGHYALVGRCNVFPPPTEIELPSGESGYLQRSGTESHPFVTDRLDESVRFLVATDPHGLGGHPEAERFFDMLKETRSEGLGVGWTERRSELPDPEIVFTVGKSLAVVWIAACVGKGVKDAIATEVKERVKTLALAIKTMAANAIPKYRPVTYVLRLLGKPNVEFVARTRDADAVIRAMTGRSLSQVEPDIKALRERFGAEMIQLELRDDGKWAFNYLLTRDGKVVGTKQSFDRRAIVLQEMERTRSRREAGQRDDEAGTKMPGQE